MTALVTVGGYEFPEPSTYSAVTSTIVDSGRNVNGYVVGSVVRHDVAKIELSWRYLTAEQWAKVLSCFTSSFYNTVTFYNQATAGYTTRTMYVSDRNAGMWRRNPATGEVMGWTNPSLSLVEV
ncbi:MAG: hypothetical protein IKY90_01095 [Oscillospiraceae bacterium]|nr:hypothetical protein [Oscillospiraceae bacterium]MBR5873312.1 hypothetical protein [Oscillospiraceae bacterium]